GAIGADEIVEVLAMASAGLEMLSAQSVLSVSDLDVLSQIVGRLSLSGEAVNALYTAIGEKNLPQIEKICAECEDRASVELLKSLVALHGPIKQVLPELKKLLQKADTGNLFEILQRVSEIPAADQIQLDFSVVGDVNYYNGIVFKGFVQNIPDAVLSGGQYDRLMKKLHRKSRAIGFAVYTDALERMDLSTPTETVDDGFVNIALPKGRLGEKIYDLFARAGFECPSILEPNRKLIFENAEKGVRYFWVKPSDVAIYVERGAADIGVAGKDILLEYEPDVYELLDLHKGKCRMAVAAPKGYTDDASRTLRVATKFANIAKTFYRTRGRDIDIIHLNGSIEIAPILGLSDVIVDIVETGTTLKENDLEVVETIVPISARLIANKASYKFKDGAIEKIAAGLAKVSEESV
ncbi:MAG: ATP phosphoribosyltransferase, partial [Clostridia bacterium]|nr:ATP phosphoribosyltransferase [Clostridia bacterium]